MSALSHISVAALSCIRHSAPTILLQQGKRSDTANIQLHYIKGAKTIIEVLNWRKAFCLASNLFMSSGETALLKNQKEFTERLERWLTLCKHRELSSDPEHPHKNWATASVTPAFCVADTNRWIPRAQGPTSLVLPMSSRIRATEGDNQHWPLASMHVCTHMYIYYRGYSWKSKGSRTLYFSKPLAELRIKRQLKWDLEDEVLHVNIAVMNWLPGCHWCLDHILGDCVDLRAAGKLKVSLLCLHTQRHPQICLDIMPPQITAFLLEACP